jgi:hypothetical protein
MARQFVTYTKGVPITSNTDSITVEGHIGTWYAINETVHNGRKIFLLEHEEQGDEAYGIAVDENGNVVCEEITDDFPECLDY